MDALKRGGTARALALSGALVLCFAAPAGARTLPVINTDNEGSGSLRNAIEAANDEVINPGPDTIVISATGEVTLDDDPLRIISDVDVIGPGPGSFTVSGDEMWRVFDLGFASNISISGLRVISGSDFAEAGFAGGILNRAESVTLDNVVVADSEGELGGGIYSDSELTINNSTIGGAPGFGNSSPQGGGILNDGGDLTINNSTISNNPSGSAIVNDFGATTTINNSTVSNNGGGIGAGVYNRKNAVLTIGGSTFSANATGGGGGAVFNEGTMTATNSTFHGNTANGFGGAIDTSDPGPEPASTALRSVTISGNRADANNDLFGNGGGLQNGEGPGAVSITNSILAGNQVGPTIDGGDNGTQCSGGNVNTYASGGFNLRQSADADCFGFAGTGDVAPVNPLVGPLAANGGPTRTAALPSNSPAVNTGGGCPSTDQRGYFRAVAAPCDRGAFELGASPTAPMVPATPSTSATQFVPATPAAKAKCKKGGASAAKKKRKTCKKRRKRKK